MKLRERDHDFDIRVEHFPKLCFSARLPVVQPSGEEMLMLIIELVVVKTNRHYVTQTPNNAKAVINIVPLVLIANVYLAKLGSIASYTQNTHWKRTGLSREIQAKGVEP